MKLVLWMLVPGILFAESMDIKMKDVDTKQDTAIVIKKGGVNCDCTEYEILSGSEEVAGDPAFDKGEALKLWKKSCADWKAGVKELNKENQVLVLSCGKAVSATEDSKHSYSSQGSYKIRVKVREQKRN